MNGSATSGTSGSGGNIGQYMNGTDAADFGGWDAAEHEHPGWRPNPGDGSYTYTAGDTMKMIYSGWFGSRPTRRSISFRGIAGSRSWARSTIRLTRSISSAMSADHAAFPTQCPTAGGPFTSFTRGGVTIATPETGRLAQIPIAVRSRPQ